MKNIHLIGNAHIDPVWLWRWPQGAAEIKATFASALERMRETPGYIFTAGAVSYYEWVMENEPAMFEEIKTRVAQGRWVPVGGWWVQPDCNAPGGESFARHTLMGQGFLQEHLGRRAAVGYNVDSFGHNAGIPQLLRKSGMKYYVMMRPGEHEAHLPTVFWWEGSDGSRVLVQRILPGYNNAADAGDIPEKLAAHRAESEALDLPLMLFYGVGNHGGGPTVATLQVLQEQMAADTSLIFSDPERYFAELESCGDRIPVVTGDLQHHASGCYSADSANKAHNRRAEMELIATEKMMTIAHERLGLPYAAGELDRAWKNVLFNQFHDIMGGCCLREALADAADDYGEAHAIAKRNLNRALQKIAWNIDTQNGRKSDLSKDFDWALWETQAGGAPIVVFNTLPWPVTGPVQLHGLPTRVEDEAGTPVPTQMVRSPRTLPDAGAGHHDTIFMANIPAMGYRVYRASRHLAPLPPAAPEGMLHVGESWIENDYIRLRVDPATGEMVELFDKRLGANLLAAPAGAVVIDDTAADTWAHGIFSFREERGRFTGGELTLIEEGPLRATLRVTTHFGPSSLRQDITLYRGDPRVHITARLLWLEEYAMAKLCYPLAVTGAQAAWEQAYAVCVKAPDGREMPAQCWGDLSGTLADGRGAGMALANDTKYSYDALDGELRLTLVRSAAYADHAGPQYRDQFNECMDLGEHTIRLTLIPHGGSWQDAGADAAAQELNNPLLPIAETYHDGPLGSWASFASVSHPGVRLAALKPARDGEGIIIRLFETAGRPAEAVVDLPLWETNFKVALGAHEFKTFRVLDSVAVEVNLMEETV